MATRDRPIDRARRRIAEDLRRIGQEIYAARVGSGLSLRVVGHEAHVSPGQVLRIERGAAPRVSAEQLAIVGAVVGLDVRPRAYPGPDPIRDAGQVRLVERFRRRLSSRLTFRTEVPLPSANDLRAWDGWIDRLEDAAGILPPQLPVEAETHLSDVQAFHRRVARKLRDADQPFVIVVLADTRHNRDAVAAARGVLASMFPVSARAALAALADGRHPGGSALIML
jgi:transcriptional regulator with XRE-family HTH domain